MHALLLLALVAGSAPIAALSLRKAAAVLSVAVPEDQLAAMLAGGEGPRLPAAARCPRCEGQLGPWPGYRRLVRHRGRTRRLRLHRARCRRCGRTHALVPSFLTAYRRDVVATIGEVLLGSASGRGHRPLAAAAAVPASTARGWIRRARRGCAPTGARLRRYAFELDVQPSRSPPAADPVGNLLEPIALVTQAVQARWGAALERVGPFQIATAVSGGRLLGPWPSA